MVCHERLLPLLPYAHYFHISADWGLKLKITMPGRGMIAQGFDLTKNSYHNRFQPYVAYWGTGWTIFFILINGFEVFWSFNATDFLTACMLPALLSLYFYLLLPCFQTSTFPSSLFSTLGSNGLRRPRSGSHMRWTLSRLAFSFNPSRFWF